MMSSFLLTEIALDLLGNKFYTVDGENVRDLQTLWKLSGDKPPTDEPNLGSLLDICNSNLDTDGLPEEDIVILDDDEDSTINITSVDPLHSKQIMLVDNLDFESDNMQHSENSSSKKQSSQSVKNSSRKAGSILFHVNENDYNSEDVNERLSYIIKSSGEEYSRMKNHSSIFKKNFLETNKTLINLKSLKEQDFLKKFYMQQKVSLLEESHALMNFIKLIKNEETYSKQLLTIIAGDILKAKDLIS